MNTIGDRPTDLHRKNLQRDPTLQNLNWSPRRPCTSALAPPKTRRAALAPLVPRWTRSSCSPPRRRAFPFARRLVAGHLFSWQRPTTAELQLVAAATMYLRARAAEDAACRSRSSRPALDVLSLLAASSPGSSFESYSNFFFTDQTEQMPW